MSQQIGQNKFLENALKYGWSFFGTAKTGQTIVYRNGDDGSYQSGYPKAGTRYIDNGDGTITDKASGLMWVKTPADAGLGASDNWNDMIDACAALSYATYSDWRLPNIKELISIADMSLKNPAWNALFGGQQGVYWSSTTWINNTARGWTINFWIGETQEYPKTWNFYARPVRSG